MDFELSQDQKDIRAAVQKLCAAFGLDYWLQHDRTVAFQRSSMLRWRGTDGLALPCRITAGAPDSA